MASNNQTYVQIDGALFEKQGRVIYLYSTWMGELSGVADIIYIQDLNGVGKTLIYNNGKIDSVT